MDCRGKKLLEIGFKNGLFLHECSKVGFDATGTEINESHCNETKKRFPELNLVLNKGKSINLPDNTFDYIVSFQVLEHVETPDRISLEFFLGDLIRLLKPGGIMYHRAPNYNSFYEGHYCIPWFPFLNRTTGRWYLKLLRRDMSNYDNNIDLIKPKKIRKALSQYDKDIEMISLGKKEFASSFSSENISIVAHKGLRAILLVIYKLRIQYILIPVVNLFEWYYPLVVIVRKIR
jgi:2-polyprenyl-3-methyl-5-hydroxy-6-metoxy-1,4-benzoquinol methylase